MDKIKWEDADLYAYLDGELNPEQVEALESELVNNVELERRLEALRLPIALMREAPLSEAPRNYLLTPSMVTEKAPEPAPRRRPLLMLTRLATTLSALAFVVMIGLQINVTLAPRPAAAPQSESLMVERNVAPEEKAVEVQEEAEMMEAPEEPAPTATAAATAVAEAEAMEASEEAGGQAPTWDEGGAPQGLGGGGTPIEEGIGGGAPPDEEVGICGVDDTSEECAGEVEEAAPVVGEEATGSEVEPVPTIAAEATEVPAPSRTVPARPRTPWQLWLAIGFGISTVLFGILTWWLARRR